MNKKIIVIFLCLAMIRIPARGAPHVLSQSVWTTDATTKIFQDQIGDQSTKIGSDTNYDLISGRGGIVFFQIVISSVGSPLKDISMTKHDLSSGSELFSASNVQLYLEYYVNVRTDDYYESILNYKLGYYPDALIPLSNSFDVNSNKNQPIWVEINVPVDIAPGKYEGLISISDPLNTIITYSLTVLDFEVPLTSEMHNPAFGDFWQLDEYTSTEKEKIDQIALYTDFFAQRDINIAQSFDATYNLPYKDDKWIFDDWIDDMKPMFDTLAKYYDPVPLRVPIGFEDLNVDIYNADSDRAQEYYLSFLTDFKEFSKTSDKLPSNIVWYLWIDELDEPQTEEAVWLIAKYAQLTASLNDKSFSIQYRIDGSIDWESPWAEYDLETDLSTWVDLSDKFTIWSAPQEDIDGHPEYAKAAEDRNKKVIVYMQAWTALSKNDEENPQGYTDRDYEFPSLPGIMNPAIFSRILPWMVWWYDISGISFWDVMFWYDAKADQSIDPFVDDPSRVIFTDGEAIQAGDGYLSYPGYNVDKHSNQPSVNGPIPSLRLELYRIGMEDYKLIKLLENNLDRIANKTEGMKILSEARSLIRRMTDFEIDYSKYDEIINHIKYVLANLTLEPISKQNWSIDGFNPIVTENKPVPFEYILLVWPFVIVIIKRKNTKYST